MEIHTSAEARRISARSEHKDSSGNITIDNEGQSCMALIPSWKEYGDTLENGVKLEEGKYYKIVILLENEKMTTQEINKKFAKLSGWKMDPELEKLYRENDRMMGLPEDAELPVPDFCADPRLVLIEMMKREDWEKFLYTIGGREVGAMQEVILLKYVLDTTGKLALAAIEFMEKD